MLVNCNALAMIRFENSSRELRKHTQQLIELKKDLDLVFKRIRFLKFKLSQQYPQAFKGLLICHLNFSSTQFFIYQLNFYLSTQFFI